MTKKKQKTERVSLVDFVPTISVSKKTSGKKSAKKKLTKAHSPRRDEADTVAPLPPISRFPDRSIMTEKEGSDTKGLVRPDSISDERPVRFPLPPPISPSADGQILPLITLHVISGGHILRLYDSSRADLCLEFARHLTSGTLIVVTPTATKVFDMGQMVAKGLGQASPSRRPATSQPVEDDDDLDQPSVETETETEMLPGMRVTRRRVAHAPVDPEFADDPMTRVMEQAEMNDEEIAAMQQGNRTRKRETSEAAPNAQCGRCDGSGQTLAGGACPVCRGTGAIRKWGTSPQPRNRV